METIVTLLIDITLKNLLPHEKNKLFREKHDSRLQIYDNI